MNNTQLEYLDKVASECYEEFLYKIAQTKKQRDADIAKKRKAQKDATRINKAKKILATPAQVPESKTYITPESVLRSREEFQKGINSKPPKKLIYWKINNPESAAAREKTLQPVEVPPSKTYKTPESVEKSREAAKKAIETKPKKGYDPSVIDRLQAEAEKDVKNPHTAAPAKKSALQKAWGHLSRNKGKYGAGAAGLAALGTGAYLYNKRKEKTASMYSENPLVNFELAKVACAEYLEKTAASHNNTFEQYGNDVVYDFNSLGKTTVNAMTNLATNPLVSGAGVGSFVGEQVARRMGAGKWSRLASTLGLGSLGYLGMHDGADQYDKRYRK